MCHPSCLEFVRANLARKEVEGKSVLEVGSLNVNGSTRRIVEGLGPCSYIGVDIQMGPGVDEICNACDIASHFGQGQFDLLISTELLEHVRDWKKVISNFKNVLRPGGLLFITTRSKGFGYHGFPFDYWRFELSDMEEIFSDFIIEALEPDPAGPGVFLKARKAKAFLEKDTEKVTLYSILTEDRRTRIGTVNILLARLRFKLSPGLPMIAPAKVRKALKRIFNKVQKV